MAIKTIDCVECGESVTYGRLSCPACGALLASVARGRRVPVTPEPSSPAEPSVMAEPSLATEAQPVAAVEPHITTPAVEPLTAAPRPEVDPTPWPTLFEPERTLAPRPYRAAIAQQRPSAYRPPAFSLATAGPAWSDATVAVAPSATILAGADRTSGPRVIDPARFVEIAGWFAIVGAAMAVLGFLLPWSRIVIGSSGVGGYFNTWGLASPTHVFVFIGLLVVLGLEIMRVQIPAWLRTGVPGLILGGLLVGLVWPYAIGPVGADVGAMVVGLGGLALVIGGVVASWATRHDEADPLV
jgi:hypothetical protein